MGTIWGLTFPKASKRIGIYLVISPESALFGFSKFSSLSDAPLSAFLIKWL